MTDIASLGLAVDSRQVKDATKALDDMAASGAKAEQTTKAMSIATEVLAGLTRRLVAAYSGLKIAQYVKDATLLNARYETLGVSMRVVGANAGYTAEQMEAAALSLQKTGITMVESRQQVLRLVSAQIDLSKASQLARIAQDAAVIGNMNSSEAFAHMIHGISTAQPEVLRTIGLNVSMERSYAEMAKTLGVTANQLTQTQKTQAILNSVMREGQGIAGVYEAAMGTAGKQLNSMQRYVENLKLTLGETFNEALVIAVEAATKGFKDMNEEAQELAIKGQLREWGRDAIRIAAAVADAFRLIKNSVIEAGHGFMFLYEASKLALKGQFGDIKKLSEEQEKRNKEFVSSITLLSDLAEQRFAIVDRDRANAANRAQNVKISQSPVTQATSTGNADAIKKEDTAYLHIIQSIREKIAVQGLELQLGRELTNSQSIAMDAMVKLRDGVLQLTDAKKVELVTELERLAAVERSAADMEFAKRASDSLISSSQSQVMSMREQVEAGRQNIAMLGMTNEQIVRLTGSKQLEMAANLRAAAQYAGPLHSAYMQHANDLEELAKMQKELVSQQQIIKTAQEWERIGTSIEQTGKTAFVQFAAHGISAAKSIGEALKTAVIDLIYQITARPILLKIGTSITGALTGDALANGGIGGNLFATAGSFVKAISEGVSGGVGSIVSGIGNVFNSSLMSAFGSGMGMSGGAAAGAAGAFGSAGMGGIGTALSMGSMVGTALPFVGAALAAGSLTSAFGAGKKIFGIKGDSPLNFVAPIIGILAGLFGKGPKQLGPSELTGDFLSDGFHGEFQADWTRKVGLFGGKKRGRRGLGITSDQLGDVNGTLFDIVDSIQSFVVSAGESSKRSLDGWSFAVKHQLDTEEQRKKLAEELTDSLSQKLIPEVVALKGENESLAQAMSRLKDEYDLTNALVDLTGQSFKVAGLQSLALRDSLIQLLGGLQSADSSLQSFFGNFYSEEERMASASRLLRAEFTKLGAGTLPATREQYRALVEAQDLSTEAGQKMFAGLVKLSPVFAEITKATEEAADDMESEAERIKNSFKVLGTESFATLFEYNKYIQLARNAGIKAAEPESIFNREAAQDQYFFPSLATGTNELPSDMTINAHRGERIIPAADNRKIMDALSSRNDDLKSIIEQLQKLRAESRAHALALAKSASKTAKILDEFTTDGMPPVRT